jgi:hypothetical protein
MLTSLLLVATSNAMTAISDTVMHANDPMKLRAQKEKSGADDAEIRATDRFSCFP